MLGTLKSRNTVRPPPKDSDFRRQILSLVRVLRQWNVFCMKQ
eukprot:UN20873